jgi:Na+/H+-dicarboxylate symporter
MAGWSFGFFLALLILAACYTLLVAPPLVRAFAVDTDALTSLKASVAVDADDAAAAGEALRLKDWLIGLVPANLVGAAARGDILPVIVGTLLFAAAMRAVPGKHRELLVGVFRAISEVTRVLASWLISVMPIAVLALTIGLTARSGPIVASGIGYFIVLSSVLLILFTLLLYPITVLGTATPLRRLARALAPAQAVAAGTRSSLASLPALLESAEARLGLPASTASFVLPLSVSVFKLNRTISSPLKLLFLAHMFGIPLAPQTVVVFVLAVTVLSFGSPGIPSGGSMVTLPFYLAAGLPLEGVVLLTAVDAIPDIFKTLLNVTADMSVAVLVTRVVSQPVVSVVPAPEVSRAGLVVETPPEAP